MIKIQRPPNIGIIILAWCVYAQCSGAGQPDPRVLMAGVEAVRQQAPSSRLEMRASFSAKPITNDHRYLVEFAGEKRRYLMLDENSPVRCLYNGNEVIRYDGFSSVTIQTLIRPTSDYLFDPRLLGITTSYSWNDSLATALPHRDALELKLVGRESVGSVMTWHVQAVDKFKRQIDMWIDESKNLRIHRYCLLKTNLSFYTTLSYFSDNNTSWVPDRVETQSYNAKSNLISARLFTITNLEQGVKIADASWSVAGVNPPNATPVCDLRINKRIGHWLNGAVKYESPLKPLQVLLGTGNPAITNSKTHKFMVFGIIALAALLLVSLLRKPGKT